MFVILLVFLFIFSNNQLLPVNSHPTFLTSSYCSTELNTQTPLMGNNPISSTDNHLIIKRGETILQSGDYYISGEKLSVALSSTAGEYIYETSSGSFTSGSCNGNVRIANNPIAYITMPTSGDVSIKGAWSMYYGGVHIAPIITLQSSGSNYPTSGPAFAPTETSSKEDYYKYPSSTGQNVAIGLIFGIGGFISLILTYQIYVYKYQLGSWVNITNRTKSFVSAIISISLGVVAVILVSEWCQNYNNSVQTGFLGFPSWKNNLIPFHVLFMAGGFLFAQVLAICSWIFFQNNHLIGKIFHFIFHTIAISSLFAGLAAIVKYKWNDHAPSLTTLHSWFGVMAISLYSSTYLFGIFMATMKQLFPDSILHQALSMKATHQKFGLSALACTILSVVTGIMAQLGIGSCYYNNTNGYQYDADKNPAENYRIIPNSCKLANGLGIVAALIGLFVFLTVYFRSNIETEETEVDLAQSKTPAVMVINYEKVDNVSAI